MHGPMNMNPLNVELNLVCHLLALLGAHPIFHVSRIRVKFTEFSVVSYMVRTVHEFNSNDRNKVNNKQITTRVQQQRLTFLAKFVRFLYKIRPGIRKPPSTDTVKVKALFLSNDT
jgi:hypothetical protein